MIKTVQIRITAANETEAQQAIDELRALCGSSRIMLGAPTAGRDKRGDGKPPHFSYGTFQFENAAPPTISAPPAATGQTERLAATGKTRRLRRK